MSTEPIAVHFRSKRSKRSTPHWRSAIRRRNRNHQTAAIRLLSSRLREDIQRCRAASDVFQPNLLRLYCLQSSNQEGSAEASPTDLARHRGFGFLNAHPGHAERKLLVRDVGPLQLGLEELPD